MKSVLLMGVIVLMGLADGTVYRDIDYPVPLHTRQLLFYIQNSTNTNTVIYDINVVNGIIQKDEPVKIYWLRFAENSKRQPLNYLERTFAYGLKYESVSTDKVKAHFVARKEKQVEVRFDEQGVVSAMMNINGSPSKLTKLFVQVTEDGWWPKVAYVEFFGTDLKTNLPVYEKLVIN